MSVFDPERPFVKTTEHDRPIVRIRVQMASAPRPWRTAQGKSQAPGRPTPGPRPPLVGAGVMPKERILPGSALEVRQ